MAGIINTGTIPKALWPGIFTFYGMNYNEKEQQWKPLFAEQTSEKQYEEGVSVTGFGLMPVKPEGQSTTYDSQTQGFVTRFTHVAYSLGFIVTKEEIADNLYPKLAKQRAGALGYSGRQTKERVGANVYDRAFNASYVGGDGVPLLSTAHPLAAGGTFSNKLAVDADLSEVSLEDLTIQMMGAVDDRNLVISLKPKTLIVPRQEWFNANRILKSTFQSGTANNDINALNMLNTFSGGIVKNDYLTSPHAWFIRSDIPEDQGLIHFTRAPMEFTDDNDFDTENMKYKAYERYSFGWIDPRALWGSNGP